MTLEQSDPQKASAWSGPVARILVVEDEETVAYHIGRILEKEGYRVDFAEDGRTALELLEKTSYEVMVTDVRMPGMSGIRVLEEAMARFPATRAIVLTGKPEIKDAVRSVKKGAVDYLQKPIRSKKLCEAVERALQAARSVKR